MSDFQASMFFDVGPLVPSSSSAATVPFSVTVRPPTRLLAMISGDIEPVIVKVKVAGALMDPEN